MDLNIGGYLRNIFQLHALQARVQQDTSLVVRCVDSAPATHFDAFDGRREFVKVEFVFGRLN